MPPAYRATTPTKRATRWLPPLPPIGGLCLFANNSTRLPKGKPATILPLPHRATRPMATAPCHRTEPAPADPSPGSYNH
ncbi:MAG: hypothetical protein ABF696_11165, partial [Acetobacter orientalis]